MITCSVPTLFGGTMIGFSPGALVAAVARMAIAAVASAVMMIAAFLLIFYLLLGDRKPVGGIILPITARRKRRLASPNGTMKDPGTLGGKDVFPPPPRTRAVLYNGTRRVDSYADDTDCGYIEQDGPRLRLEEGHTLWASMFRTGPGRRTVYKHEFSPGPYNWRRVGTAKRTSPPTVVAIKHKRVWGHVVGGNGPAAVLALYGGWRFSNGCVGP